MLQDMIMDKHEKILDLARRAHEKDSFNGAWLYAENGEIVGGLAVASLLFFYICGQATYNANGYSYGSAQMAWSAVKHIAFIGLVCLDAINKSTERTD